MDWLGWTLTNSGRLKDGSEAFKKALAIAPENVSAQTVLAMRFGPGRSGFGRRVAEEIER